MTRRIYILVSVSRYKVLYISVTRILWCNREYLAPQIRSMNNRFHSEAKLPWLYDYPVASHTATYKSTANREVSLGFAPLPFFRVSSENFPAKGFKILPIHKPNLNISLIHVIKKNLCLCSQDQFLFQILPQNEVRVT